VANPDATLQALIGILSIAARSLSRQLGSSQRPVHLDLTGPPQRISG
jgi:hypothetical protein